jgi:hypothetical protein
MTHPRRLFRRIAKWTGTAISSLILAIWILSVPVSHNGGLSFSFLRGTHVWEIAGGVAGSYDFPAFGMTNGFYIEPRSTPRNGWASLGICLPSHTFRPGAVEFYCLPLWLPFLIVVIPAAFLWHHDRRRIQPGHCPACNYNLTGNTSGICPECGTATPSGAIHS